MSTPQTYLARKAAKATVKHSAHGVVAKASRKPLRTTTLLGLGALLGAGAGWTAARLTAPRADASSPASPTTPAAAADESTEAAGLATVTATLPVS